MLTIDPPPLWQDLEFRAMGTDVRVVVAGGAPDLPDRARIRIERLEARWSRFRPESEIARLNAAAGEPVVVSPETFAVVARAIDAARATEGRFDPTVHHAMLAAGYDASFDQVPHEDASPAGAPTPAPGADAVELDPVVGAIRLDPGVGIDLGGIAKGYAADRVAIELGNAGADGVCVSIGGDIRVAGIGPEAIGWTVAVDDPLATGATGSLVIRAGGVATSTRLRRSWRRAGVEQHHILDPFTGAPAWTGLCAVTVLAAEAWWAEIMAKAAFIAGPQAGAALLAEHGLTGLFVHDDARVEELSGLEAFRR